MVESDGMSLLGVAAAPVKATTMPLNAITITVSALIGGHTYSATMKGFMSPTTVPVGSQDATSIEVIAQVI